MTVAAHRCRKCGWPRVNHGHVPDAMHTFRRGVYRPWGRKWRCWFRHHWARWGLVQSVCMCPRCGAVKYDTKAAI